MSCDQCEMVSINGVACHETGCPNSRKHWNGEAWVSIYECRECGHEHDSRQEAVDCCSLMGVPPEDETDEEREVRS